MKATATTITSASASASASAGNAPNPSIVHKDETDDLPNSLAEWARTVDLEPLLQKRKEIHRQKREGRPSPKKTKRHHQTTTSSDYLKSLSRALRAPSSPYSSNIQVKELYAASKQADQLGERKVAIDLLQTLLMVTPTDARVHRRLARMYAEQGDIDKARATLQTGLQRLPQNQWLWHGIGQLELKYGSTRMAREHFQKAITYDPTFAHSYHALGTMEHTEGNIAQAMRILKKGLEFCPTNHRLLHAYGDVYRAAQMLEDAVRSYRRALEHSPPVSHCFAYSALAAVAYEQGQLDEARSWLFKSVRLNNGRHAQGWVALAQLEESEGNFEKARLVCASAITQYERGLIESRQRYLERNGQRIPKVSLTKGTGKRAQNPIEVKNLLLSAVPRYRSGDKFLKVYYNWARLEERHGTFESVDQVYGRACAAFPFEFKLTLAWASYHADMLNHERARGIFSESSTQAGNRHAEPYRRYAEMEMSLSNFQEARKILFRGVRAVSQSTNGGLGNSRGLPELFHTWAICEWHLGNLARAEVLFDHSLRLIEGGVGGSRMRSFVLYSIARLEHEREEMHLAQHCVGLALKENAMPGGDCRLWKLWADIAEEMGNESLEEQCLAQVLLAKKKQHGEGIHDLSRLLTMRSSSEISSSAGPNMKHLMRSDPWQHKLFGNALKEPDDFFRNVVRFPRAKRNTGIRALSVKAMN